MLRRISFFLLMLFSLTSWAELTLTTYACPSWPCTQTGTPLSTSVTSGSINYNWGGGQVLNSGRADYVSVKATGYITIPGTPGQNIPVYFGSSNDDGSMIIVNGTTVVNDWSGLHPEQFQGNIIYTLIAGQTYPITIWFSEWGGGAIWRTYWSVPGGPGNAQSWVLLDTTTYTTTTSGPTVTGTSSGYITTTSTSNGVVYTYRQPVTITTYSDGTTTTVNNGTATLLSTTQIGTSTGITTAQTTTKNSAVTKRNNITNNNVYVDQAGSNNTFNITQGNGNNSIQGKNQQRAILNGDGNTVTIKQGNPYDTSGKNLIQLEMTTGSNSNTIKLYQGYNADGTPNYTDGDGHIISLGLTGSSNQITVYQTNTSLTAGHYADLNINGSTNNIAITQKGNSSKTLFSTVSGNNNTISAAQDGLGSDYLNINLTGNGHNVTANQAGTGNHLGYIDLTNSGGASTVNLNQTGSVSQSYSIIQNCLNPTGCSVSVTQP